MIWLVINRPSPRHPQPLVEAFKDRSLIYLWICLRIWSLKKLQKRQVGGREINKRVTCSIILYTSLQFLQILVIVGSPSSQISNLPQTLKTIESLFKSLKPLFVSVFEIWRFSYCHFLCHVEANS